MAMGVSISKRVLVGLMLAVSRTFSAETAADAGMGLDELMKDALMERYAISREMVTAAGKGGGRSSSGAKVWFVKANMENGNGSFSSPFNNLRDVEAFSNKGDMILVLPARGLYARQQDLDGGIALKNGQLLLGIGADPFGYSNNRARAAITNSDASQNGGNGIILANDNIVHNLTIRNTYKSGVYGFNAQNPSLIENLLSNNNVSLALEREALGPTMPLVMSVPSVSLTYKKSEKNASIMPVRIEGNHFRDSRTGALHLKFYDVAAPEVAISGNRLLNLDMNPRGALPPAMFIYTAGTAVARVKHTGQFVDRLQAKVSMDALLGVLNGASKLYLDVSDFTVRNSTGSWSGLAASGIEVVNSPFSTGTEYELIVADSEFDGTPGEAVQALVGGQSVRRKVVVRNTRIINAGTQGIALWDFNMDPNKASEGSVEFLVENSSIENSGGAGIRFEVMHPVTTGVNAALRNNRLAVATRELLFLKLGSAIKNYGFLAENNTFTGGSTLVSVFGFAGSEADVDFGGGPLGSKGGNDFLNYSTRQIESVNQDVFARHNCWGKTGEPTVSSLYNAELIADPSLTDC